MGTGVACSTPGRTPAGAAELQAKSQCRAQKLSEEADHHRPSSKTAQHGERSAQRIALQDGEISASATECVCRLPAAGCAEAAASYRIRRPSVIFRRHSASRDHALQAKPVTARARVELVFCTRVDHSKAFAVPAGCGSSLNAAATPAWLHWTMNQGEPSFTVDGDSD